MALPRVHSRRPNDQLGASTFGSPAKASRTPAQSQSKGRLSTGLLVKVALTLAFGVISTIFSIYASSILYDEEKDEDLQAILGMATDTTKAKAGAVVGEDKEAPKGNLDPKAGAFLDNVAKGWGEHEKALGKRRLYMEVLEKSKERNLNTQTLAELRSLPSTFDSSLGESDTTIILNHWSRDTLAQQLEAILSLTVVPKGGVWVCAFDSPKETEVLTVLDSYRGRFLNRGGLYEMYSGINFKYFGRFQLALQATTKYVWFMDDDVLPGSLFLELLSHVAGTKEVVGALGSIGWIMPGLQQEGGRFPSYRDKSKDGGLYIPDRRYNIPVSSLQEVDLLCSQWFLETEWIKLLFREAWITAETGEDYALAYALRKYAGVPSYVMPMDLSDSASWGNTDVYWETQTAGTTAGSTTRSMVAVRDKLWHRLLKQGGTFFQLPDSLAASSILMVLSKASEAAALEPIYRGLYRQESRYKPYLVFSGESPETCVEAAAALHEPDSLCDEDRVQVWDLHVGETSKGRSTATPVDMLDDVGHGLTGVVAALQPAALVTIVSDHSFEPGPYQPAEQSTVAAAARVVSKSAGTTLITATARDASAMQWLRWLPRDCLAEWHTPRVELLIVWDPEPPYSHSSQQLASLLGSLQRAVYLGDAVDLTVVIGKDRATDLPHGDVSEVSSAIVMAEGFGWPHGEMNLQVKLTPLPHTELLLDAWSPKSRHNYVLPIVADRYMSWLFYAFLKAVLLQQRYSQANSVGPFGICVPNEDSIVAGYVTHNKGAGAWLLSPEFWEEAQRMCSQLSEGCTVEKLYRMKAAACPEVPHEAGITATTNLIVSTWNTGALTGEPLLADEASFDEMLTDFTQQYL
ncbi:unnamed protein product [Chrysoparadoxa australica]